MQIRRAILSDAIIIQRLAESIWWKHYPSIIGEEQVRFMLHKMYNLENIEKQISKEEQQYFILENDGQDLGFFSIEVHESSAAFINKFYILQDQQRKGIGAAAFQLLLKQFPEINCIRLQVNRQNYQAINFYFKQGFVIEKVADFDIGDGYFMNDFIMKWKKN
jgi:ribosomal protein S18 acetylase RimI-like enzyme